MEKSDAEVPDAGHRIGYLGEDGKFAFMKMEKPDVKYRMLGEPDMIVAETEDPFTEVWSFSETSLSPIWI